MADIAPRPDLHQLAQRINQEHKQAEEKLRAGLAHARVAVNCSSRRRPSCRTAMAHYNRGVVHQAKGDLDKAIADYSEAIRLDPKLAAAYAYRGKAYHAKGELGKALADYSEAFRLDPSLRTQ